MTIIEYFTVKKIWHYLMESNKEGKKVLFVLPDFNSLFVFDPILKFFKSKFKKVKLYSGLVETIKNRESYNDYIFINMLNVENLRKYDLVIKVPEIYDYEYFIPEIIGIGSIPDLKMDDKFNYVIDYFKLNRFVIINVEKDCSKEYFFNYVNVLNILEDKNIRVILIGDSIECANLTHYTEYNPIVIYQKNIPLISDLLKKCLFCIGNIKPSVSNIKYKFVYLAEGGEFNDL